MSHIKSFSSHNVKRIEAVHMEVKDNKLVIITGMNGEGKSSLIDSIIYGLAGSRSMPSMPIRKGEESAKVMIELDDYIIKRSWSDKKTYLTVEAKDGSKVASPQTLLDKMRGELTIDPLEFRNMKPAEQISVILRCAGIETELSEIERKIEKNKLDRKEYNRDFDKYKKLLEDLDEPEVDLPNEKVNIDDMEQELADLRASINDQRHRKEELERLRTHLLDLEKQKEELEKRIKDVTENGLQVKGEIEAAEVILAKYNVNKMADDVYKARETNEKITKRENYVQVENWRDEAFRKREESNSKISALEDEKLKLIRNSEIPVEGLTWDKETLLFNGIPFSQCSDSEQIRTSFAMGMAMNPELKVIFTKHGDKLDDKNMLLLAKLAEERDYQFWIERVYENELPAVIIEEGKIKGYKNIKKEK